MHMRPRRYGPGPARLLSAEEAAWLWTADREAVVRALQHKGWRTDGPAEEMAVARRQEAWAFVTSIAPDAKALRFLLAEEEFLNLFVWTMAQMSGGDQAPVWALPCITPPSVLRNAAAEKDEQALPHGLQKSAKAAWQKPQPRPAARRAGCSGKKRERRCWRWQKRAASPQRSTLARAMVQADEDKALFFVRGVRTGQRGNSGAPWPGRGQRAGDRGGGARAQGAVRALAAGWGKGPGG